MRTPVEASELPKSRNLIKHYLYGYFVVYQLIRYITNNFNGKNTALFNSGNKCYV